MKNGIRWLAAIFFAAALAGCGSQRVSYAPSPAPFTDREEAAEVVEQAFYEDYRKKFRPQSVLITDKVIVLADGVVSRSNGTAAAVPVSVGAIATASSTSTTKESYRRIYLNSVGEIAIYQRRSRPDRHTVVIRAIDGRELAAVSVGSLDKAQRFCDALTYLTRHSNR